MEGGPRESWLTPRIFPAFSMCCACRVVRLPVHIHDLLNQIGKAERELHALYGRQPTEAEIAARVDIPQRKLQFLRQRTQHTMSMDAPRPAGGSKSSSIGEEVRVSDSISDPEPLQDVKADEAYIRDKVEGLLSSLNPREADVVSRRRLALVLTRRRRREGGKGREGVVGMMVQEAEGPCLLCASICYRSRCATA